MNAKAYEIIVNPLCDLAASTNVYIIYSEWNCRNRTVLSNPCLWSGVYCNGNEVVELVITSVKLRGTIPSALGCLTGLQTLDFSNNLIAGSIPSNFGQLINLQYLLLQENLLVSSVPSTLGNLTNLFYLSLYDNLLTSTIPSTLIAISNSVKYFYIFNNFLTSSIPAFLGVYSRAITIRFEENYFSSTLPSQLCNLSRLEYLRLNDNLLTSSLPTCLFSITSLQYLNLAYNAFTGSIPSTVHNCKSLIFLVLNNNQIGGQPPLSLCALSTLTGLYIGNNQFKCHPYCQSDVNWTSETAGYRCQDFQDEIMYSLQQNLDIFSALSRVVYTDKRTIVYSEGTLRYYSYTRAFQYLLVLNFAYFHADNRCLLLNICADAACNEIIFSWNDTSPPIFPIRRSSFYVDCPLCDLCPGWQIGYDLTVHSYADSNWAFLPTVPYNSTSNSTSRYARGLCQKAWSGIQCERGLVTSIQLPSLGLSGTLPTSIGLLSGLSALDFASNGIKGSIPTTMALLKSLNTLVLTNNHVIGQIPSQFSALENLVFLDAGYNSLTGSIPTYFYSMSQLAVIYLDGNSYNGQVSSVLCEYVVQKNVTVSMKYSPVLVCYQESCWSDHPALREKFMDNYLPACSPTHFPTSSLPTSQPTRTTQSQITVSPALSPSNIAIITCTVGGCFLFVIISIVWRRLMSEKATVRRRRTQRLEELPVHRALIARPKLRESEWMELVETHLHTVRELDADGNTAIEILLQGSNPCVVPGAAIALLLEDSLPPLEDGPSTAQRGRELDSNAGDVESDFEAVYEDRGMVVRRAVSTHAWALAVQHDAPEVAQAIERVLDRHKLHIHALANACDKKGRCCKYIAQPRIKTAMLTRLYLHRRYELKPGPALHKSATSLVIQARDHGSQLNDLNGDLENDGNKVVLKFMRNRDHFLREVGARLQGDFDERFVLPLLECYDKDSTSDDNVAFRLDATSKGFEEYPYCVVMEAASFNLKHVIDQQLIAANDWEQIKQISRQLAQCLDHLHSKGVIHGDFKRELKYDTVTTLSIK